MNCHLLFHLHNNATTPFRYWPACASGSLDPSHVLLSIGLPHEIAHCSLRISFGVQNTMDDAKAVCDALDEVVPAVRQRSPLWRA